MHRHGRIKACTDTPGSRLAETSHVSLHVSLRDIPGVMNPKPLNLSCVSSSQFFFSPYVTVVDRFF